MQLRGLCENVCEQHRLDLQPPKQVQHFFVDRRLLEVHQVRCKGFAMVVLCEVLEAQLIRGPQHSQLRSLDIKSALVDRRALKMFG